MLCYYDERYFFLNFYSFIGLNINCRTLKTCYTEPYHVSVHLTIHVLQAKAESHVKKYPFCQFS